MTRIALLMFCLLACNQFVAANTAGVSGRTGASTCSACHSALGTALLNSTGSLEYPANVTSDTFISGKTYTLNFVNTGAPSAAGAGFNLGDSLSVSQFSAQTGTSVQAGGAEISHSNADNFSWSFDWESDEITSSGQFQWCTTRTNNNGSETADGPHSCGTRAFNIIANQPPSASAGPDQTLSEGTLVNLNGSASTDEFPDLAYAWTQSSGPTVALMNANTATPSFIAPEVDLAGGSVVLSLTVTEVDHDDLTDSDTLVVNVTNINQAPVADAGPDQSVAESSTVTLDGSGTTDPDADDTLTYAWLQTSGPSVTLSATNSIAPTFTSPATSVGGATLEFQLTVTDLAALSTSDTVTINVLNDNEPPVAVAGADQNVDEGTSVQLSAAGSTDETPASLLYAWVQTSGPTLSITGAATASPSFTAPEVGFDTPASATIQLTVTDAFGLSATDSVAVSFNNLNIAPSADAGSDQTVGENVQVTLNGTASVDPDVAIDDVLTYAWAQMGGDTVSLASANTATPTFQSPSVGAVGGSSTFLLTVTDRGSLQSTDTVVVNFTDGNISPVANAGADQMINEGSPVNLSGLGSTDDVPATLQYTWSQTGGPSVTLADANTATPSFTAPEVGFDGPNAITLSLLVTDEESLASSDTVMVNVINVNQLPVADAGTAQTVGENIQVNLNGTASTDPDIAVDDVLSYAWTQTGGIPVSLTAATSATPTFQSPQVSASGGTATFLLTVTDRGALQSSDTVVVTFTDGNVAPFAEAGSDQNVNEGSVVSLNGSASTDDVPATLQYAWSQLSGPSVSITGANTATPSFTAPEVGFDTTNTITLSLTVTDEETLASIDTVMVTITNLNQPPVADAGSDQTVGENVPVSLNGTASTDPDLGVDDSLTYAWTQTDGIPVTLSAANSDQPTFESPSVGTAGGSSTFRLTVTDRGAQQSSDSVVVNFSDGNLSPVADAGFDQSVNEGTLVSLDGNGTTDDVPATLQYQWSQLSGPGVTISGATSATASFTAPEVGFDGATAITVSLTVTDEESLTGTDVVIINVNNLNQPPVANSGPDQNVAQDTLVALDGSQSSDPDIAVDDFLLYNWTQISGPAVTLSGPATSTPTFTSPTVTTSGTSLGFQLVVTDRGGLTDSGTVLITLTDQPNEPPTANAGTSVEVPEQLAVSLNGSASADPDGNIVLYQWTQIAGPAVDLQQADEPVTSFTAPEVPLTGATLTFQLQVTDDENLSATAAVNIYVRNTAGVLPPVAAILPSSRSATTANQVSAFTTILNPSDIPLTDCAIAPVTSVAATFSYFSTDPATNAITGAADTPVDISARSANTFALFFTPNSTFDPIDVEFNFECTNAPATQTIDGVNTLLLSAADTASADVIALVATVSADGVVRIPGPSGAQAFGTATANVGSSAEITASAEVSNSALPLSLSICESNPATGVCLAPPAPDATSTLAADETTTYSVFVSATGDVTFDPANHRIRVVFRENGVVRGSTSVAVTTQ